MKKAFTLSEALVTLAILGILAAILIPVIDEGRPDKDKITYKKALYTLQNAVTNAMDSTFYEVTANSMANWDDPAIDPYDNESFCGIIADMVNTAGQVNCGNSFSKCTDNTAASCYEEPNFISTDGVRYWGLEGRNWSTDSNGVTSRIIYVDRHLSDRDMANIQSGILRQQGYAGNEYINPGLKIRIHNDGKITTGEDNENFAYENDMIEESLQVTNSRLETNQQ